MLFNSIPYLIFFPIVLALYWASPKAFRRPILLVASYVFYMSWIPAYGALIALLTAVNYLLGRAINASRANARAFFVVGVVANLGALCFFKYANFVLSNVFAALGWFSKTSHQPAMPSFTLDVILPLGISFFAFEFIHYLTDVYRGGKPITGVVDFALFAAFFPSQLAGPIKRYQDFVAQLSKDSKFSGEKFNRGVVLLLQGLFKKAALADNLAVLANRGFGAASQLGAGEAWLTVLAFTLQIYFDFSGYTDMGRGSALLMGFELPDNFAFPYLATSLKDFWKRWHISLSSWLRDYLYIPLGGSRGGTLRTYKNLLLTMLLGGLWHGAAWHFVIWGGIHGSGLVVNHWYDGFATKVPGLKKFHASAIGIGLSSILTFGFVVLGWIFFRADYAVDACNIIQALFNPRTSAVLSDLLVSSTVGTALIAYAAYAAIFSLPNYFDKNANHGNSPEAALQQPAVEPICAVPVIVGITSNFRNRVSKLALPSRLILCCAVVLTIIGFAPAQQSAFIYFQF